MSWIKLPARFLLAFSCDPRKLFRAVVAWPRFFGDLLRYWKRSRDERYGRFHIQLGNLHPFLLDRADNAGSMGVYFHQDLCVARRVFQRRPASHLDIGSRIDGFVGHLLVFMDVNIVDVRALRGIEGLTCVKADARQLGAVPDNSILSLSCLHALEHFGLGRYGDEVDPRGWEKALAEMCRVLAPGGWFYLSVPVGRERVEFNGQRVFAVATILEALADLEVVTVTFINREGLVAQVISSEKLQDAYRTDYEGCVAIFEVRK